MRWLAPIVLFAFTAHELYACDSQPPSMPPMRLSQTGLFADMGSRTLAPGVEPFRPAFELWSDGVEKRRWIRLPPGKRIDTTDVDHWRFPPGTRLWKEFRHGGRPLETRLIQVREGQEPWMGTFVWVGGDAVLVTEGAQNVAGTNHDVPADTRCASCHGGESGRVLGFSAVQLSEPGATPTLSELAARGLLSHPVPARRAAATHDEAAALGRLHANCGHCHGPTGIAYREVDLTLRLPFADAGAVARGLVGSRMQRPGDGRLCASSRAIRTAAASLPACARAMAGPICRRSAANGWTKRGWRR